jgi:four helix bundle protein
MLHEKLDCYRESVVLAKELAGYVGEWPRGYGYLVDQLRRAMASVVLNLAEGNARMGKGERKRFFQISRASLAEVSACIDLASAFSLLQARCVMENKERIERISKMLYRLR